MNLQDLINQGDQLLDEEAGSSLVRFWQSESLETIKGHGEGAVGALEPTFRYAMIMRNKPESPRRQAESIKRSQQLMRVLQGRKPRPQEGVSPAVEKSTKASLSDKLSGTNMTFHGPVSFGDNSPANQIEVREILVAMLSQAEATLPEGDDKKSILEHLKALTENPTFAAIAGSTLGTILGSFLRPPGA